MNKPKKFALLAVGTDTELFLRDANNNKPVPAIGLIGGTKNKPRPILGGKGFAVQEDNVMVEFNIPPAKTAKDFSAHIERVLDYLSKEVEKMGLKLDISPACVFEPGQLEHPQAKTMGCEPDFCVWTQDVNQIDNHNPILLTTRSSGGHIHVSFTVDGKRPTINDQEKMVAAMDIHHGLPSKMFDKDTLRRQLYGKAGAFRPKKYGVEYRVLSNAWITTEARRRWAFESVERAISFCNYIEAQGIEFRGYNAVTSSINGQLDLDLYRHFTDKRYGVKVPA